MQDSKLARSGNVHVRSGPVISVVQKGRPLTSTAGALLLSCPCGSILPPSRNARCSDCVRARAYICICARVCHLVSEPARHWHDRLVSARGCARACVHGRGWKAGQRPAKMHGIVRNSLAFVVVQGWRGKKIMSSQTGKKGKKTRRSCRPEKRTVRPCVPPIHG